MGKSGGAEVMVPGAGTLNGLTADLDAFVQAYLSLLKDAPDSGEPSIEAERRAVHGLLTSVEGPPVPEEPVLLEGCKHIDAALAARGGDHLIQSMVDASSQISHQAVWRNKYSRSPGLEDLFENFAFCDFVGPNGWTHSDVVTLGLVLLGPNTYYPFHEHPARELYFLLSGASEWAVDFGPFILREPGTWLLHEEMQPHAMNSGDSPMLAISVWRGEIDAKSRFSTQDEGTN